MAIRTRLIPDRWRSEHTVESVPRLSVSDPRLTPHRQRIFVDCNDSVAFEFFLGHDQRFTLRAMYRHGEPVAEVHPDQGWATETELVIGAGVTIRFDFPVLPLDTWTIQRVEISLGR